MPGALNTGSSAGTVARRDFLTSAATSKVGTIRKVLTIKDEARHSRYPERKPLRSPVDSTDSQGVAGAADARIGVRKVPIPSISIVTTSPGFRN